MKLFQYRKYKVDDSWEFKRSKKCNISCFVYILIVIERTKLNKILVSGLK